MSRFHAQVYIFMGYSFVSPTLFASDGLIDTEISMDAGTSEGDTTEESDAGMSNDPVSIDATVTILTPTEGETLEGPWIEVTFHVQGCTVNGPSQDPSGCHLHKILDGVNYEEEGGGGLGHYNPTPVELYVPTAGNHEIKLVLVRNDGTDLPYEPEVSASVNVNVELESALSETETDEEAEEEDVASPIREKSEGCSCSSMAAKNSRGMALLFGGLILLLVRGRRRI